MFESTQVFYEQEVNILLKINYAEVKYYKNVNTKFEQMRTQLNF